MSHKSEVESGAPEGVATYVVEAGVALIGMVLGAIVMWGSWELGAGWTTDGPGSGAFPFYMGLIMAGCCTWIFGRALIKKNHEVFVDNEALKRVLSVLIPLIVYVAGVQVFGTYVAGSIYIALFMVILGKFSWLKSILVGLGVSVFFFFMFEVWFLVPLAKGMLDPLSFLGY
jgi:ABC-type polysaccharide/polyol phosphate export permease